MLRLTARSRTTVWQGSATVKQLGAQVLLLVVQRHLYCLAAFDHALQLRASSVERLLHFHTTCCPGVG